MDIQLKQAELDSRSFLIQFYEVMAEFGNIIPWLEYLKSIKYSTDEQYFKEQMLSLLRCQNENDILPYQLINDKSGQDFLGSIIHFKKSPERFRDFRNIDIMTELESQDYKYITCLQVRDGYRRKGLASILMNHAVEKNTNQYQRVWAVLSDYNKQWYPYFNGAIMKSPKENLDNLWIISWDAQN